jgi:8-oxo-dGTP pyrophosphatase MutT (NUDIX family)
VAAESVRSATVPAGLARRSVVRTEYLNDPGAPTPTRVVVAATAFVATSVDDAGRPDRVLLIQREDTGRWALPGGTMDVGERITETAVRETSEETGVTIQVTGLVGIYSNPRHVISYSDGEVRQQFSLCFRGIAVAGTPTPSPESLDARWVDVADLRELDIHPEMLMRIAHGLANRPLPHLG